MFKKVKEYIQNVKARYMEQKEISANQAQLLQQIKNDKAQAQIDYAKFMEEMPNKDLYEILPAEFRNRKRGIIYKDILNNIEAITKMLNELPEFKGIRTFDIKEVAYYGLVKNNYCLKKLLIPISDYNGWFAEYVEATKGRDLSEEKDKKLADEIRESYKHQAVEELKHRLQYLKELWDSYEQRKRVQQGLLAHSYDMEDDGFPRTSRANLCGFYIPIKGKFKPEGDKFILFNPRKKKEEIYKVLEYKEEDDVYKCKSPSGKEVFFCTLDDTESSWDALFSINKEIFSGWWNKILINKQ